MGTDFYRRLDRIDRLIELGPAEPDVGSELLSLIQDPDVRQYFFKQASSSDWIDILPDSVLLEREPSGGWVSGIYLRKVAATRSEDTVRLCRKGLEKWGVDVLRPVLNILRETPPDDSVELVPKVVQQLRKVDLAIVGQEVAAFSESLLEDNRSEAALELLGLVIELKEPDEEASYGSRALPRPKVRPWQYEKLLAEQMQLAFEVDPVGTWTAGLQALEEGLRKSGSGDGREPGSGYWRSAIEEHAQNEPSDHLDALLAFVRDKAEALVESGARSAQQVIRRLRESPEVVFKRLELYLCQQFKEETAKFIRENITDRELFESTDYHHEYYQLLNCCFDVLEEEEREQVLKWIDDQQETFDEVKEQLQEWLEEEVSSEQVQNALEVRRLKRLSPIAPHLQGARKEEFVKLREQHGEPEHPDFLAYHYPVRQGPESPHDQERLESATVDEIVASLPDLLGEGKEDPSLLMPAEGVSRQLASIVSSRPAEFSACAPEFMRGGAKAAQAVLSGLRTALDTEAEVNWGPVIELCTYTLERDYSYDTRDDSSVSPEREWARTRRRVADLLAKALAEEKIGPEFEHRQAVWALLEELVTDPDPDPEKKETSDLDPTTESINTTRGQAMHAVFRYCLWVKNNLRVERGDSITFEMRMVDEADQVLVHHLDPSQDASLAVRAVYGQWFPSMLKIDEGWATRHVGDVFPASGDLSDYWATAWVTYLTFWGAYRGVYAVLRSEYKRALERLDVYSKDDDSYGLRDPAEQLGHHLVALYWQGTLEEHGDEDLLEEYFAQANQELRVHTLEFVGRSLKNTEAEEIGSDLKRRLRAFWNTRLEQAREDRDVRSDLHGFVGWFTSGVFEPKWALEHLHTTLRLCRSLPQHPSGAIEKLGELAKADPATALDCLILLVAEEFGIHSLRVNREAGKRVLEEALHSEDEQVRERTKSFIDGLGRRGLVNEFRELVKDEGVGGEDEF